MASEMLTTIRQRIESCIETLYERDSILFERNSGDGVCERCIVFRFAHYLQLEFVGWYVDCDFNSSSWNDGQPINGKLIENPDGTVTKRFVDIIIHRRSFNSSNDFVCFEIKKWNNYTKKELKKDINNLEYLTRSYGYNYGFLLILGKTLEQTKWRIFAHGHEIQGETNGQ